MEAKKEEAIFCVR